MEKPYYSLLGISPQEREKMLEVIGIKDVMELFSDLPKEVILDKAPVLPFGPMTELELVEFFNDLAKMNKHPNDLTVFLGGGVRQIYVPALVDELIRRGELYTAYTAYQPEVSQGILQLLFEYQSLVAELTGMEVVNASMYDWSTAAAEAALTAIRITRRDTLVIASPLTKARKSVIHNYLEPQGFKILEVPLDESKPLVDIEKLKESIDENTAAVYLEMPNAMGYLDPRAKEIGEITHDAKAKFIVGVDPLSLGLVTPPGEYGADLVVGEGQPLGNAVNFGGPLLGIFAFNYDKKDVRRTPGRLIGITKQLKSGKKGFTITLQAREQHIKRAKATSNICSNEALTAVISAIYLSALGPKGMEELSIGLHKRALYLRDKLSEINNVELLYQDTPFFADFAVKFPVTNHEEFISKMVGKGFVPGAPWDYDNSQYILGVSELHDKKHMDAFADALKEVL